MSHQFVHVSLGGVPGVDTKALSEWIIKMLPKVQGLVYKEGTPLEEETISTLVGDMAVKVWQDPTLWPRVLSRWIASSAPRLLGKKERARSNLVTFTSHDPIYVLHCYATALEEMKFINGFERDELEFEVEEAVKLQV